MQIHQEDLKKHLFSLISGDRIFLQGVPGAGKTTFTQELIRHHLGDENLVIVSPTYTYYQKYGDNVYHFDLYRATTLSDIMRIGADEILEDPNTICLIEWPEIIKSMVHPTKIIDITIKGDKRDFDILDVKTE
jgi:tRNA threonylcarbamoyladenosine biosynthesis protein TsaE